MGVYSGKYSAINGLSTTRLWTLSELTTPAEFRTSNLYGGTGRSEGVYDYQGMCEGYAGVPPVMPSEYFDFLGFTAPTTGAHGTAGITKSADNAICDEVAINWNWRTGELLNWTMRFSAGEPLIITEGSSAVTDATIPAPKVICGTKVTLTTNDTLWNNIVSASLTITANNPTFVNSSTGGCTGRRPGIIDWTAAIVEETSGENTTLTPATCLGSLVGGNTVLRLWCDATTYWDLMWAHYVNSTDLRADNDTGAIIGQTNNFAMAGVVDGVIGRIGRPGEDGASNPWWWPDEVIADVLPFTSP